VPRSKSKRARLDSESGLPNASDNFPLPEAVIDALKQLDTCILSDAVEMFDLRLRNQGYTRSGLRAWTGRGPVIGYASTALVKSSEPPLFGRYYFEHQDWWAAMQRLPKPRIAVIQDIDGHPGIGACIGQLAAAIFKALDCNGAVTNGAVRDLPVIGEMNLPVFAAHVSPSHSYSHLTACAQPVDICGLRINPGDLLVADVHGVLSIPLEVAARLAEVAADLLRGKRKFIKFCQSSEFSLDGLVDEVKQFRP
jgi:4-hydroxy-4-methyl-2-oxoglutarate aldolase